MIAVGTGRSSHALLQSLNLSPENTGGPGQLGLLSTLDTIERFRETVEHQEVAGVVGQIDSVVAVHEDN